ncbi:MAG: gliding motility-associated C-terminal domain-containing protein [Bacteroidaceae bacterium]|nr:gliding motility-associated C-terminal domain-containing protein [Bacteroidaceae bacterium]
MKHILFLFLSLLPFFAWAQTPTVDPVGTYYSTDEHGEEETGDVNGTVRSVPFRVVFTANPTIPDGYKSQVWYEWTMWKSDEPGNILLRRNDETLEYDFRESGSYVVQLRAIFYGEEGVNEDYEFPQEGEDQKLITFTGSESKLEFPNAISPNGDDRNDELKPKEGYKSIVSFHAAVFNRWGQKLYSWDDIHGSWDGKYKGKRVKDGVYFLVVSAKGGDGIDYNIKKAINVISGYNNDEGTTGEDGNQ